MNKIKNRKLMVFIACMLVILLMGAPIQAQTSNIEWYKPYYNNSASLNLSANKHTDNFFDFDGKVDTTKYKAVLVKIVREKDEVYYYYPLNNGTVEGQVYLRFGKGTYQIEVNLVKPDPNPAVVSFDRLAKTTVENNKEDDRRYLDPSWGIESNDPVITDKAIEITKNAKTDYERVKAVHDWVSKNIKYDIEKYRQNKLYDNEGALKALTTRQGLCRDYSNLTTALCRTIGIEAKTVIGQAGQNGKFYGHAWNEVKVGKRWISMDTTWDAGTVSNNKFTPRFSTKYFDMDPKEFNKTHVKAQDLY